MAIAKISVLVKATDHLLNMLIVSKLITWMDIGGQTKLEQQHVTNVNFLRRLLTGL